MCMLSLCDIVCVCVNIDCVDVNWLHMQVCCLIEQIGCYVDVDVCSFLDVDFLGMYFLSFFFFFFD